MVNTDEDALICDLAETYGILNYKGLPLKLVATFSVGLSESSRIIRKINDIPITLEQYLLADILDSAKFIAWAQTQDASEGKNRPKSILNSILNREERSNVTGFSSADDYEKARIEIMRGGYNGNYNS